MPLARDTSLMLKAVSGAQTEESLTGSVDPVVDAAVPQPQPVEHTGRSVPATWQAPQIGQVAPPLELVPVVALALVLVPVSEL